MKKSPFGIKGQNTYSTAPIKNHYAYFISYQASCDIRPISSSAAPAASSSFSAVLSTTFLLNSLNFETAPPAFFSVLSVRVSSFSFTPLFLISSILSSTKSSALPTASFTFLKASLFFTSETFSSRRSSLLSTVASFLSFVQ